MSANAAPLERFHPQYRDLHAELLARPFPVVSGNVAVAYRAILFTPAEAAEHRVAVTALASQRGVVATPAEHGFQILRWGVVDLRIERHTEFTAFMVIAPQGNVPLAGSAIDQLPPGVLDAIPGRILAAVEVVTEPVAVKDAGTAKTMERVAEFFSRERLVGAWVVERVASVWIHFKLDERGATRFLVQGHRLTSGRYGRLLQRLVEIETYRLAALLSLPLARELLPQIEALEAQHLTLVERIGVMDAGDERALLSDLTNLSLTTERLQARCGSRFSLTESYARIVAARVRELRPTLCCKRSCRRGGTRWRGAAGSGFADSPPRGCARGPWSSAGARRARSVPRRNLLKMALDGTKDAGVALHTPLIIALALPLLAGVIWWSVRRAKHHDR